MAEITTGSAAFFSGMEGFKPKVTDKVKLVDNVKNGWWHHVSTKQGVRLFEWQRHPLDELVAKLAAVTDCKRVSTLLVPEFAQAIGYDDAATYLTKIAPAIDTLCDKHQWGKTIYAAYVENGSLTLTDEQREAAYAEYKAARPESDHDKREAHGIQ